MLFLEQEVEFDIIPARGSKKKHKQEKLPAKANILEQERVHVKSPKVGENYFQIFTESTDQKYANRN